MLGGSRRLKTKNVALIGLLVIFMLALILLHLLPEEQPHKMRTGMTIDEEHVMVYAQTPDKTINIIDDGYLSSVNRKEAEINLPTLKNAEFDVPIVIVDEHQEVVPYWYKAVDEKLMLGRGNTLIHIDGHSDMACPDDYNLLRRFRYVPNAKRSTYLPLMQRNDVFIASAIIKGLIKHVVWVTPDWYEDSKYTTFSKSFLGATLNKRNETILCECMQKKKKGSNGTNHMSCSYEYFDVKTDDDVQMHVKPQDCVKIRDFTYVVVSEKKFIRLVNLKKVKNLFIDIDEDYFGVESGVKQLVDRGVRLKSINVVDDLLKIYCPDSVHSENQLAQKIRKLFKYALTIDLKEEKTIETFLKRLVEQTSAYICGDSDFDENVMKIIASLNKKEIEILSEVKYCRANSPVMRDREAQFELCHGTIYPDDTLNQIYVGDEKEIETRGKQLSNMIQFIYNHTQPRLFTIARSLRDGYTPRRQQTLIEKTILENLDIAIKKQGKKMNVIYDDNLVFGKQGWN